MRYIDVTFREAAIINGFTIDKEIIYDYINIIKKSDIDYVELGYVNDVKNSSFLLKFDKDLICKSNEILKDFQVKNSFMLHPKFFNKNLFDKEILSKIGLIRIACSYSDIDNISYIIEFFKKAGVKIAINLIRISEIKLNEYLSFVKKIANFNIDTFYIADTNGSFLPNNVLEYIKKTKKIIDFDMGFHAHDNLGLAMNNVMESLNNGVKYIDGSFMGFGKGAGNLKTEIFLPLFSRLNKKIRLEYVLKTYKYFLEEVFLKQDLRKHVLTQCKFGFYGIMNNSLDFDRELSIEMNYDSLKEIDFIIDKLTKFNFYKS